MVLGKTSPLSKKVERDLRYRINRRIRFFVQTELPLLEERGFATALGHDAAFTNSGCTVRSSILDSIVAPSEPKLNRIDRIEYEKRMLRPGFEPGISDSKGRYA
jgi:hypothetical protein